MQVHAFAEALAASVLAMLFARTRCRAILVLCTTQVVSLVVHADAFLHALEEVLTASARGSSQASWFFVVAVGTAWYTAERIRPGDVDHLTATRLLTWWLPLAIVGTAMVCVVAPDAGLPSHGIPYAAGAVLLAACFFAWALRGRVPRGLDGAIVVGLVFVFADAALTTFSERPHILWFLGKLCGLGLPIALIVATVRLLLSQLSDEMRIEATAMSDEADARGRNAAVEAAVMKSQFVATVSHELRTPLGGVAGMAELLERTPLNDAQRSFVAAIRSSADTLLRTVNDLLDFSHSQSGRFDLEQQPFALATTIDDLIALFRSQTDARGVHLHAFIDPALPSTIYGDSVRLTQVLQNLLNNAVRFTQSGSIRLEVTSVAGPKPLVRFAVKDTGIGIAASALGRIFEPFVQAEASTGRRFGGTGLGLAISQHIVELMGGHIEVESTPGVGSTFSFAIPLRAEVGPDVSWPLRNLRALIIEGDDDIATLLGRYAEAWGMRFRSARTISEAQACVDTTLRAEGCEVVLVGPAIATADALAFARANRNHVGFANSIWIVIRDGLSNAGPPPGFDAVITGPVRQSALLDVILRLRIGDVVHQAGTDRVAERPPRPERILVAEDNEVNALLIVAQLQHLGFSADVVSDGESAVTAAATGTYQLIFMDCQMPGIDGFEAARRIRLQHTGDRQIPIIALTASVLSGSREQCLAAGMNDYLAKPALIKPLVDILDRWLPDALAHAPAVVEADVPGTGDPLRARLREIFHGDEERVERTIALAFRSLTDGMRALDEIDVVRDPAAASRAAHKIKGIALDIGFASVVERARALEAAIKSGDQPGIESERAALRAEIERVAPT